MLATFQEHLFLPIRHTHCCRTDYLLSAILVFSSGALFRRLAGNMPKNGASQADDVNNGAQPEALFNREIPYRTGNASG